MKEAASRGRPSTALIALVVAYQWFYNGANFLAFKVGVTVFPAFVLSALRFSSAALLILPLALWRMRRMDPPTLQQVASAAALGSILLAGSQAGALWGVKFLPAGVAAVLTASSPLFLAIFAWAFLGEIPGVRQLLGILIGFCGLVLIAWFAAADDRSFHFIGAIAVVAAAAAWACGSLLAAHLQQPDDAITGLTIQLIVASVILWPIAIGTGELATFDVTHISAMGWASLSFLVVASTLIGYAAFLWLNRKVSSTLANTFSYVAPIIALGLSEVFLGETLTWPNVAASTLSLTGVALMSAGTVRARQSNPIHPEHHQGRTQPSQLPAARAPVE